MKEIFNLPREGKKGGKRNLSWRKGKEVTRRCPGGDHSSSNEVEGRGRGKPSSLKTKGEKRGWVPFIPNQARKGVFTKPFKRRGKERSYY